MKEKHSRHDAARSEYHMYGHTLLRVVIGLLFIITGWAKLQNPAGIIGMVGSVPLFGSAATLFGWVVIISELLFGALILIGYKVRYTAWPLAFILLVATLSFVGPNPEQGWLSVNAFFHYISIAVLVSLAWTGPGEWAISEVR